MSLFSRFLTFKIKACLFLFRFWSEHWNLTVLMRNRLLSTPLQHMICTSMTGNTQKPHQHHRPGKEIGPYICVHKNLKTWRCNLYNIWWLLLRILHNWDGSSFTVLRFPWFYVYRKNARNSQQSCLKCFLTKKSSCINWDLSTFVEIFHSKWEMSGDQSSVIVWTVHMSEHDTVNCCWVIPVWINMVAWLTDNALYRTVPRVLSLS